MVAIANFECRAPQQLATTPAALPNCAHARLSIGLDQAYCPDCRRGFSPKTPEYGRAIALPLDRTDCADSICTIEPAVTKNGSGVPGCGSLSLVDEPPLSLVDEPPLSLVDEPPLSPVDEPQNPTPKSQPEPTPEPKTVISTVQWVESYPTKKGLHHYYRFRWLDEPNDIRSGGHRHICGGNIHSSLALARKAEIESAIALGQSPREILHLMKSWCSNG